MSVSDLSTTTVIFSNFSLVDSSRLVVNKLNIYELACLTIFTFRLTENYEEQQGRY